MYLDDILIYSKTEEYHLMHVKEVSKVLSCNGLFLNTFKSDSDYEEILDSESEVEEELQYESVDDYEEVIGQESLNRESISTIQRNEPNLIETAFKKRWVFQPENLAVVVEEENHRVVLQTDLRLAVFNVATNDFIWV